MVYKARARTVKSESVFLDGIECRRYPDSKNWSDRVYYKPNGTHAKRGIKAYHHELWKSVHGDIPQGYHVHHRDGNPSNNSIDNLECISDSEHRSRHGDKTKSAEYKSNRAKNLDKIRPLAVAWHKSPEGKAWHKQQSIDGWNDRKPVTKQCLHCGKEYQTLVISSRAKFCSANCKEKYRRASGKHDVKRICVACGKEFEIYDKYATKHCSRSCAASERVRDAAGRLQSND